MSQVVSITSQGQLTIPKSIRDVFKLTGASKAVIEVKDDTIIVKPKVDFWSLEGALHSTISLSDDQLKEAKRAFSEQWGQE